MRELFLVIILGYVVVEFYILMIIYIYFIFYVNNWRKWKIMELMVEFGKFLIFNLDIYNFEDWFVNVFLILCMYYFLSEYFIW